MARMRVHELAKEFGLSSKEMLEKLKEMNIPAKNHASTLVDAYVDKIRKKLGPEIEAQRAAQEEAQKLADEKKAEEEAAKKKVTAEQEAAARHAAEAEAKKREAEEQKRAKEEAQKKQKEGKIARDKELAARERERQDKPKKKQEQPKKKVVKTPTATHDLNDLLTRVEAESKRLEKEKAQEAAAAQTKRKKPKRESREKYESHSLNQEPSHRDYDDIRDDHGDRRKSGKKRRKSHENEDGHKPFNKARAQQKYDLQQDYSYMDDPGEDRYKKMADNAEKMQRQRILDEARAMVDAASMNESQGRRKKRKEKREALAKKRMEEEAIEKGIDPSLVLDESVVQITTGATVSEVADALAVNSAEIIKKLFLLGTPLTVTQTMSDDLIDLIADDLGRRVRIVSPEEQYEIAIHDTEDDLEPRPPVVTVMGHVDHGKTSLLDAIRQTGVVETEAGGITQAIGASVVDINGRQITFIDTPGHEAFTAMRARGAKITDVVVLVVAADDGVMPQTIEAINHAKAANVPIVVAVNKIDKPGANPDKVRQELTEYEIIPEEWGGDNMFVEVSAKQNINIDDLLETILLQADVLELKANPNALASGFVIEANLDKGRGPVATVLVQRGTLKVGDAIVAGKSHGRVRALISPKGEQVNSVRPADPAEVLGLDSVPAAGDEFRVFEDERDARNLAEDRALRERLKEHQAKVPVTLDDFFNRIEEGKIAELNLVLKADTQGSIEALKDAFAKMDQSEVRINVIHSAVGGITETDVILAAASDAIIIGFGVRPQTKAKQLAEKEKVDIRTYRIIYKAIEEINAARVGLLKPDIVEVETATVEVRETFKVPKVGVVAGCLVSQGEVNFDDKIRVVRDGTIIHEGEIASLRRFKDDVKSVRAGYECGIGIVDFQDIKLGDTLETYQMKEIAREG